MSKIYLIFEWDTYDVNTIVHGYVIGDEDKAKSISKRTLRELKSNLGREYIYYCELPKLELDTIDLSNYSVFDHEDNAIRLSYPCTPKEEIEFMIETSICEKELNSADFLLEESYMSDDLNLDEYANLSKLLDMKRLNLA